MWIVVWFGQAVLTGLAEGWVIVTSSLGIVKCESGDLEGRNKLEGLVLDLVILSCQYCFFKHYANHDDERSSG